MISVVRPGKSRSRACSIIASEWLSSALVASSRIRIRGSRRYRAGDGDALALAPRQTHAALPDLRRVAVGKGADVLVNVGVARRRPHFVVGRFEPSVANVLDDRAAEELHVLRHDGDRAAQVGQPYAGDIDSVDQQRAFLRLVKARNQIHDRRLAGARRADQRDDLSRFDRRR